MNAKLLLPCGIVVILIITMPQVSTILNMFWSQEFWLPSNLNWKDFENLNTSPYELLYPLPAALLLLVIHNLFIKTMVKIVGPVLGLKSSVSKLSSPNLETVLKKRKNSDSGVINKKVTELRERQTEPGLRQQRLQDKTTKVQKLAETTWRCLAYTGICLYGVISLWQKSWLWDTRYCWYTYPHDLVDGAIWWYYMIELTFYWSLTFSQIYGDSTERRKDFWQMLFHHFITISLICFSWVLNMVRAGSLVLVLHDISDAFLEAAKICKYANYQKACNIIFGTFVVIWVITRLYLYPAYILKTTMIESIQIVGWANGYYVMNGFMVSLQILHVIWTYYILKALVKALGSGNIEGDARSDSDD